MKTNERWQTKTKSKPSKRNLGQSLRQSRNARAFHTARKTPVKAAHPAKGAHGARRTEHPTTGWLAQGREQTEHRPQSTDHRAQRTPDRAQRKVQDPPQLASTRTTPQSTDHKGSLIFEGRGLRAPRTQRGPYGTKQQSPAEHRTQSTA